jgi:uncharacterized SAM-binding protein YcdF (DUF218 family)
VQRLRVSGDDGEDLPDPRGEDVSHFLGGGVRGIHESVVRRPYACVKVELGGKTTLRVLPGVFFVKAGSYVRALPEKIVVVDEAGETVTASGQFYVTSESIDPYHLLIDAIDGNRPF